MQKLGGVIISEAESQVLLDEFDLEKTGRLNFAEFTKMMSQDSMGAGSMERGMNELAPVPPETPAQ